MRAFIFDEAGTGKTKRSMDLLDDAEHILVICPASVVKTAWLPQISQWSHGKAMTIDEYRKHGWLEDYRWPPSLAKCRTVSASSWMKATW